MLTRKWYQASKPEMEFNIINMIMRHCPGTHRQEIQHFNAKTTVYWRSTHGAEHIPHCAFNMTFVILVFVVIVIIEYFWKYFLALELVAVGVQSKPFHLCESFSLHCTAAYWWGANSFLCQPRNLVRLSCIQVGVMLGYWQSFLWTN